MRWRHLRFGCFWLPDAVVLNTSGANFVAHVATYYVFKSAAARLATDDIYTCSGLRVYTTGFMSDAAHVLTDYISTCLGFSVHTTFFMSAAAHIATDAISTCLRFRAYTTFFLFDAAG